MRHESTGVLRYSQDPLKLILEIDPGIAEFYRSLIPKWIRVNRPRYTPHISVVRNEIPPLMESWGKFEGWEIPFCYDSQIHVGQTYIWLNVHSVPLGYARKLLGLTVSSEITRPPEGFHQCFHTTIANRK
jgi:hypothetical protein